MRSRDPSGSVACSRTRASLARRRSREDAGSASGLARSAPRGRALAPFVFSFTPPREVDEDREGSASRGIQSETNLERARVISRVCELGNASGRRRERKDRAVGRGKCENRSISRFSWGWPGQRAAASRRRGTSRSSVTLFPRRLLEFGPFRRRGHTRPARARRVPSRPSPWRPPSRTSEGARDYRELTEFQRECSRSSPRSSAGPPRRLRPPARRR